MRRTDEHPRRPTQMRRLSKTSGWGGDPRAESGARTPSAYRHPSGVESKILTRRGTKWRGDQIRCLATAYIVGGIRYGVGVESSDVAHSTLVNSRRSVGCRFFPLVFRCLRGVASSVFVLALAECGRFGS